MSTPFYLLAVIAYVLAVVVSLSAVAYLIVRMVYRALLRLRFRVITLIRARSNRGRDIDVF